MRGKENGKLDYVHFLGITPAYAGKSSYGSENLLKPTDHPRLCGEKEMRTA